MNVCVKDSLAQTDERIADARVAVDGLPKIPASLVSEVRPYTKLAAYLLAGWHPSKRELWVKSLTSLYSSVYTVTSPGDVPQVHTVIPTDVYDVYYQPQGTSLVYVKDTDGNEVFQLYAYELAHRRNALVSDGKSRNTEPVWSNHGDRVIYSSNRRNGNDTDLYVVDPSDPNSTRLLAQDQGYLKVFGWSPDDTTALFYNWLSSNESYLYTVDVVTGQKTLLTPKTGNEKIEYDFAQFSSDGKGIYLTTDRDSEFLRLAYMNLATKELTYLSDHIKWNIEDFKISPDRKTIAFISNEDGVSHLHLHDTAPHRQSPITSPGTGVISNLRWHNNGSYLAFAFSSARAVSDIFVLDLASGKAERWVKSITDGVDVNKFSEAELIHWKSFDDRQISGFLYRPPAKFAGKRPVIIDVHGGPDDQARPDFNGADNYFINALGIARIYPNVRGSSGYRKNFLKLDNGYGREDAVKDIGAVLDWIKTQPFLDADRIMVTGSSYVGYVPLSVATNFSDCTRAPQPRSGPPAWAPISQHTKGYRPIDQP